MQFSQIMRIYCPARIVFAVLAGIGMQRPMEPGGACFGGMASGCFARLLPSEACRDRAVQVSLGCETATGKWT